MTTTENQKFFHFGWSRLTSQTRRAARLYLAYLSTGDIDFREDAYILASAS